MLHEEIAANAKTQFYERLFRDKYAELLQYAQIVLKRRGASTVSVESRAEEVVQEVFSFAWEKSDEVLSSPSPVGWLYNVLKFKVYEAIRDDCAWVKRLALIPAEEGITTMNEEPSELESLIPKEDYELLCKLYLEGYSYKEVCDELGIKKSALAMRVSRAKEKLKKKINFLENE